MKTKRLSHDPEFWKEIQRNFKPNSMFFCHASKSFEQQWRNEDFQNECWDLMEIFNRIFYPKAEPASRNGMFSVMFNSKNYGVEFSIVWSHGIRAEFLRWVIAYIESQE